MADFARLHRVTRAAVTGWKRRGLVALTPDGKVEVQASNERLGSRPTRYRGGVVKVRPGQRANGSPANSSAPGVESAGPAEWSTVEEAGSGSPIGTCANMGIYSASP